MPVGTAERVDNIINGCNKNGYSIKIVSNPEFLREGTAVFDFLNPNRIVVGSSDLDAIKAVAGLFKSFDCPLVECDNRTAEMSKYASNVFLATRVSFINEMALICDEYGVDIEKVSDIIGLDPRFGKSYLKAGLGWGGSCLPKDVRGLISMAKSCNIPVRLLSAVQEINEYQLQVVINKLSRYLGPLKDKSIGILGLAFKPGAYDIREARSVELISRLEELQCQVKAYDPLVMHITSKVLPKVTYCENAYDVAKESDAVILVTEWNEFKDLDFKKMSSSMNCPVFIDARNQFNPDEMSRAGFIYDGIGHRASQAQAYDRYSGQRVDDVPSYI